MPKVKVVKPFAWSEHGWDVVQVPIGVQDVSDACAKVALAEKWAEHLPPAPSGRGR